MKNGHLLNLNCCCFRKVLRIRKFENILHIKFNTDVLLCAKITKENISTGEF